MTEYEWLRHHIESIENKMDDQHRRVGDRFDQLHTKLDQHAREDAEVEKRVAVIETERKIEAKQANIRSSYIALLVSVGLNALAAFWRGVMSKP